MTYGRCNIATLVIIHLITNRNHSIAKGYSHILKYKFLF